MNLSPLTAISPIDGRYRSKTEHLDLYFSEFALIRYRIKVEIEYFIALCEMPLPQLKAVTADKFGELRNIYKNFSLNDANRARATTIQGIHSFWANLPRHKQHVGADVYKRRFARHIYATH